MLIQAEGILSLFLVERGLVVRLSVPFHLGIMALCWTASRGSAAGRAVAARHAFGRLSGAARPTGRSRAGQTGAKPPQSSPPGASRDPSPAPQCHQHSPVPSLTIPQLVFTLWPTSCRLSLLCSRRCPAGVADHVPGDPGMLGTASVCSRGWWVSVPTRQHGAVAGAERLRGFFSVQICWWHQAVGDVLSLTWP